jgi:hypothetical protein
MSKSDKTLGDFHKPSNPAQHPTNSIGNQQVWNGGKQVGAIEFEVNPKTQSLDLNFSTKGGKKVPM